MACILGSNEYLEINVLSVTKDLHKFQYLLFQSLSIYCSIVIILSISTNKIL
jgi:hypothetical protein